MLNEDELKQAQRALGYLLANADLTTSEKLAAQCAYEKLDTFIDGDAIASVWMIDDVFSLMFPDEDGDRGHTENEISQAREVLQLADRHNDATVGINWDVLSDCLDEVGDAA